MKKEMSKSARPQWAGDRGAERPRRAWGPGGAPATKGSLWAVGSRPYLDTRVDMIGMWTILVIIVIYNAFYSLH